MTRSLPTHTPTHTPPAADAPYFEHDPDDALHGGARMVVGLERDHLRRWRGRMPRFGLALSGGGIRSASFCLGVLQALAHKQVLPRIDYLSTVSGGGYTGGSLTYLLHRARVQAEASDKPHEQPVFDAGHERFPYLSSPMVSVPPPTQREGFREKGRLLHRLRQNAKFLVAGRGITLMSLVGVLLRNLAVSLLVHAAMLLLWLQLFMASGLLQPPAWQQPPAGPDGSGLALQPAGGGDAPQNLPWTEVLPGLLALLGLLTLAYALATPLFDRHERASAVPGGVTGEPAWSTAVYRLRRGFDVISGVLVTALLCFAALGLLGWLGVQLQHLGWRGLGQALAALVPSSGAGKTAAAGGLATVAGLAGQLWGLLQSGGEKTRKPLIPTPWLVNAGAVLLLLGVALLVYVLAQWLNVQPGIGVARACWGALALLVLLGWWPDANYLALHRYYRDRLMEVFLPDLDQVRRSLRDPEGRNENSVRLSVPGDQTLLGRVCGVGQPDDPLRRRPASPLHGPYHLINTNVVLVASRHPGYRARGGDGFVLSPLVCGSRATGWQRTGATPGQGMTVATAMAISGAALNPNAGSGGEGVTRQPALSTLMGMLNLRLGYWFRNPSRRPARGPLSTLLRWLSRRGPNLVAPGMGEAFWRETLNEHEAHVLLTDGGHFENLGLYELVRRRLKLIVVCDAAEDLHYRFGDLANAIEKVRTDFGALIDLSSQDLAALVPDPKTGVAAKGWLMAPITYAPRGAGGRADTGVLLYLKASFWTELSADLHGYKQAHPSFPQQSTGDQFFDERQFEAYRELGYQTAFHMVQRLRQPAPGPGTRAQALAAAWAKPDPATRAAGSQSAA
jgi:hypothetical protein